jgi:hypothetical protein
MEGGELRVHGDGDIFSTVHHKLPYFVVELLARLVTPSAGRCMKTAYYFWVELIDARGKTAGLQPAGTYTMPTVWEIYVAVQSRDDEVYAFRILSSFGMTPTSLFLPNMGSISCG